MEKAGKKQLRPGDKVRLKGYGLGDIRGIVTEGYNNQNPRVPVRLPDGKLVVVGHDRVEPR